MLEGRKAVYYGESGYSIFYRLKFHLEAFRKKTKDSIMFKHAREFHPGKTISEEDFVPEVLGQYSRPIVRQSQEGVSLSRALEARRQGINMEIMNSKNEFLQPGVVTRRYSGLLN